MDTNIHGIGEDTGPGGRKVRRGALAFVAVGSMAALLAVDSAQAAPPALSACPTEALSAGLPSDAKCYSGQDANGAYYLIAVPNLQKWNGMLVVHAHGGPTGCTGVPGNGTYDCSAQQSRTVEDLTRWVVTVQEGFAWAASSFRRRGYGTRMAAEDTEIVRGIFFDNLSLLTQDKSPTKTLVHGQSWGGNVAAKVIEIYNSGPVKAYDGALLTSGVNSGGTAGYMFRADLRAVYQFYCNNHPYPNETQYPLWQGLPLNSTLTTTQLRTRLRECTDYDKPTDQRDPKKQENLTNILNVTRIAESNFASHMSFATFTFRDLVMIRLDGRNPFSNWDVRYEGSTDDKALNKGVQRFKSDWDALQALGHDADMTGEVSIPVITLHAIDDPQAFVENDSAYQETLRQRRNEHLLVQLFTAENEHSFLQASEYAAAFRALAEWATTGSKPAVSTIVDYCEAAKSTYQDDCLFDTAFVPDPFFARTYPRAPRNGFPSLFAE